MIIVIGGIKGGSGKTTIATNLCQMRAASGKKVLLVDADEQKSSFEWSNQRESSLSCNFTTICLSGKSVYSNLLKMRQDYDDIIVDTGGRDTTSQRAALAIADKFLIPFKPSSVDIWTIGAVKTMISENTNQNLQCYVVISQADPKGKDNEDALSVLAECELFTCLPNLIGHRKSFRNAAAEGMCVHELPIRDEKACKEMDELYESLYSSDLATRV